MNKVTALILGGLLTACAKQSPTLVPAPEIVPRAAWNARPPVLPMDAHSPTRITIHHTGVLSKPALTLEKKLQNLQLFSQREDSLAGGGKKPAWPDVPYHYYIDYYGRVGEGRDVNFRGDTNTSYDPAGHILVVVEGNFQEETPTPAQLAALHRVVRWLAAEWDVERADIRSHKDYARTECPGVNLYREMDRLRAGY